MRRENDGGKKKEKGVGVWEWVRAKRVFLETKWMDEEEKEKKRLVCVCEEKEN